MSLTWNFGTGSQGTAVNKSCAPWVYNDAIRVTSEQPGIAKFTDILSPIDLPTEIKISATKIANVYDTLGGGKIPVAEQSANVSGCTTFFELKTVATYPRTSPEVGRVQLPMVARIEFRLPNDANIDNNELATLLSAALANICNSSGTLRVLEVQRGGIVPKEI